MNSPTEAFRAAMRRHGLDYAGPIHADGRLHRFKAVGDKERNSWYVLHVGPPSAGAFGCWRRGLKETWHARNGELSQTEWNRVRQQWQAADAVRQRTEADLKEKARATAKWILAHSTPASPAHPYLKAKGVGVHGELRQRRGSLVLPLRDVRGALHSLQFISPDGEKRFLRGGRVSGCFFGVAGKGDGRGVAVCEGDCVYVYPGNDSPIVIAEGYATAASVASATGWDVACAMNAGNLPAVSQAFREKFPSHGITLAADNDVFTAGNPGVTAATAAAKAVGARLAVPQFADVTDRPTDFNDLHQLDGLAAVREQIESATVPAESDDEAFERLSKLSAVEFDRVAKAEATRLGVKATTLAKEVAKCRPQTNGNAQGFAVDLPDVEVWPDPVDGAQVLNQVAAVFSHYVFLPDGAADALALWTAHTHCFEAFLHTPRLNLRSAEKGCGKTTLLDVIGSLVPRAMRTESMTSAVLFRVIDRHRPVLLLDEVDAYLDENEELRGLLNAGHRRGARAYRVEGESLEVRGFNAFAPAVLAGIGGLTGKLSTLHDRSVVVDLVRAKAGELAARFDSRSTAAEIELCRKLARWAQDDSDNLQNSDPALPAGVFNRLADNWRPLFAVAEVAGGEWPRRAADAFAKLPSGDDLDAQGIGATLLADIAAVFAAAGSDKLASVKLAEKLAAIEGRPWHEYGKRQEKITANQVAKLLRRFKVSPHTIRVGDDTAKGYELADFTDCFARFLPTPSVSRSNTVTTPETIDDSRLPEQSQQGNVLPMENATLANKDAGCDRVTFRKPETPAAMAKVRPDWPAGKPVDPALAASILAGDAARKAEAEAAKAEAMFL